VRDAQLEAAQQRGKARPAANGHNAQPW